MLLTGGKSMTCVHRDYFPNLHISPDTIWQYLACSEKIAYFQAYPKHSFIEQTFCDDINICLYERESSLSLDRAANSLNSLYYNYHHYLSVSDPEDFIYNQVYNGRIVGFNTEFTLFPNYTWYQDEKHRNSPHYSMIVGFDDADYYVADAPNLLAPDFLQKGNITLINKKELLKAFVDRCSFLTVTEEDNFINRAINIKELIYLTIERFYSKPVKKNDVVIWYGKAAFERLKDLFQNNDVRLMSMGIFEGPFIATTISGRRDLLKRCIAKYCGQNPYTGQGIQVLEQNRKSWAILANSIQKAIIKYGKYVPVPQKFEELYAIEKETIDILKLFIQKER